MKRVKPICACPLVLNMLQGSHGDDIIGHPQLSTAMTKHPVRALRRTAAWFYGGPAGHDYKRNLYSWGRLSSAATPPARTRSPPLQQLCPIITRLIGRRPPTSVSHTCGTVSAPGGLCLVTRLIPLGVLDHIELLWHCKRSAKYWLG